MKAGQVLALVWLLLALALPATARAADECAAAVLAAEHSHATPPGLLGRIALVESGRLLPGETKALPWPWTIDIDGRGMFFESKAAAVEAVRQALAVGAHFIDVGCMQVDLQMHPGVFRSLEDAFDPAINTDYAASYLRHLYAESGEWDAAVGLYHSHTPWLGAAYRDRVAGIGHAVLAGPDSPAYIRVMVQGRMQLAERGSALWIKINRQPGGPVGAGRRRARLPPRSPQTWPSRSMGRAVAPQAVDRP